MADFLQSLTLPNGQTYDVPYIHNLPYSIIIKRLNSIIEIKCFNLTTGKTYYIYMYNCQKHRGKISMEWRHPMNYPIAIDGMSQSGLYVVRIMTGTGSIYQGKILFE